MKTSKNQRTRNWTFVVYPESVVPDWKEKLEKLYTQALISPLHNKDKNPDGTDKKPHYHVLLIFKNVEDKNVFI